MAVMDILAGAQGGAIFASVGQATGLPAPAAAAAMEALCPAIARQLMAKSKEDPATFETLLDLLEEGADGSVIDDARLLTGSEAVADGEAILEDIYGSSTAARTALAKVAAGVPANSLPALAAISATAVLGALAKSNAGAMPLAGAMPATGGGGLLNTILTALIKGLIQGASRSLAPRRRRSTSSYARTRRRRRTTTRRRTATRTPSLEDIFGEILGTKRT